MSNQRPPSPPQSADGDPSKSPFQNPSQNNNSRPPFIQNNNQQQPFTNMYVRPEYQYPRIDVDNSQQADASMTGYPQPGPLSTVPEYQPVTTVTHLPYARASQYTSHHHHQPTAAEMRRSRSGSSMGLKTSPRLPRLPETDRGRVQRNVRVRRRARASRPDKCGPLITAPLSVLTKDLVHIPIRDMEAWVNRSIDTRRREVIAKNGKIARPMNSFMLYRSAYAERTKEWCSQNNHQVVSRASGQSWPLEPKEVRDLYERFAATERDNHQKAHPDYKFAPNKNQNTPKKKLVLVTKEEERSDLEDAAFDLPICTRPLRQWPSREGDEGFGSRNNSPFDKDSSFESRNSTPFDHPSGELYMHPQDVNRSSWEMINPGRPLPGMLSPPEQSHYYQPSIHQSMLGPGIEDVTYKKMGIPGSSSYEPQGGHPALPGLPPPPQQQQLSPRTVEEPHGGQVDPQLLQQHHHQPQSAAVGLELWQVHQPANPQYVHTSMPPPQQAQPLPTTQPQAQQPGAFHPGPPMMENNRGDAWGENQATESNVKQEYGQEFDQWLTHPHNY